MLRKETYLKALREDGFGARPQYDCYLAELPPGEMNKEATGCWRWRRVGPGVTPADPAPTQGSAVPPAGGSVVGYVLSTYTYSAWKGRNLYMDNLYIQPQFRGRQIGKQLLEKAAQAAVAKGCGQLRMHVANWKPNEMGFLAHHGGEDLTAKEGWTLFRFEEDALRRLAARSTF
ncbi:helicase SKI2W [Platysternon megacephalum]|uniref:Helicase SKI2W n=1 Tax=Platysternon megacephalum TaxID=55544 RepID=A0A4D9DJJ4_9SAUR|nr:helicase SKI2W [Platysternon megacephalum]